MKNSTKNKGEKRRKRDWVPAEVILNAAIKRYGGRAAFELITCRAKYEWTQKQVAEKAHMSLYRVRMIEQAKREPTMAEATQLASVLECSPGDFFAGYFSLPKQY